MVLYRRSKVQGPCPYASGLWPSVLECWFLCPLSYVLCSPEESIPGEPSPPEAAPLPAHPDIARPGGRLGTQGKSDVGIELWPPWAFQQKDVTCRTACTRGRRPPAPPRPQGTPGGCRGAQGGLALLLAGSIGILNQNLKASNVEHLDLKCCIVHLYSRLPPWAWCRRRGGAPRRPPRGTVETGRSRSGGGEVLGLFLSLGGTWGSQKKTSYSSSTGSPLTACHGHSIIFMTLL